MAIVSRPNRVCGEDLLRWHLEHLRSDVDNLSLLKERKNEDQSWTSDCGLMIIIKVTLPSLSSLQLTRSSVEPSTTALSYSRHLFRAKKREKGAVKTTSRKEQTWRKPVINQRVLDLEDH